MKNKYIHNKKTHKRIEGSVHTNIKQNPQEFIDIQREMKVYEKRQLI